MIASPINDILRLGKVMAVVECVRTHKAASVYIIVGTVLLIFIIISALFW